MKVLLWLLLAGVTLGMSLKSMSTTSDAIELALRAIQIATYWKAQAEANADQLE